MTTNVAAAVAAPEHAVDTSLRVNIGRALCVAVPLILWFAPIEMDVRTKHTFAIASFMILAWITEAVEYALAGFIGCYLFWALGVVPFAVAFSGFATDTPVVPVWRVAVRRDGDQDRAGAPDCVRRHEARRQHVSRASCSASSSPTSC